MKHLLCVALALVAVAGFAYADLSAGAISHVRVLVSPNVSMEAGAATVDAGAVQTGLFSAVCTFRVDANQQIITLYAEASPLYKGNDPLGTAVLPIPLQIDKGILVKPVSGNAMGGASNTLAYTSATGDCDGFPTVLTVQQAYESSQNNHFSQDVNVTVWWNQDDPEKPTGEYSGCVRLSALIL